MIGDVAVVKEMTCFLISTQSSPKPNTPHTTGAETKIIQDNRVNTMAADALAPCGTRSSATLISSMQDKWISIFQDKDFNNLHLIW